jgi:hypothetical protein
MVTNLGKVDDTSAARWSLSHRPAAVPGGTHTMTSSLSLRERKSPWMCVNSSTISQLGSWGCLDACCTRCLELSAKLGARRPSRLDGNDAPLSITRKMVCRVPGLTEVL